MTLQAAFSLLGYLAGALTTFAFLPQLLHTLKTKSVDDLHPLMLVAFNLGLLCWLIYGIYLSSWPIILANFVTFAFNLPLLVMRIRYGRRANGKTTAADAENRGAEAKR